MNDMSGHEQFTIGQIIITDAYHSSAASYGHYVINGTTANMIIAASSYNRNGLHYPVMIDPVVT